MKKVAVVLAGCGVYDGAEIHESVLTLLALERKGVEIHCIAPDIDQIHIIDHLTGETIDGERNVLIEAARIARGKIKAVADVKASEFDAVIFPGGYGVTKNLSNFAMRGADCAVNTEVEELILDAYKFHKPLGFMCIAPVLAAKVLGTHCENLQLTIGDDAETAAALEAMGAVHVVCEATQCVVDTANRVVTTPAYMSAANLPDLETGIGRLVDELLKLAA